MRASTIMLFHGEAPVDGISPEMRETHRRQANRRHQVARAAAGLLQKRLGWLRVTGAPNALRLLPSIGQVDYDLPRRVGQRLFRDGETEADMTRTARLTRSVVRECAL